ncbi:MAG: flagellar hook-associated protein FlgK, partial [Moorellaceae bacterium]
MAGGTFFALNTALRGLMAQQKALQTTAHNVANASTEGYTRQRVVMAATFAYPVPSMSRPGGQGWQVGTGVEVQEVRRMRDEFLDGQIRYETHTLGAWEVRRDFLQEMEEVFAEPSDTGLSTLMSDFWAAWQELAKNPESSPVRTTVVETSISLAEALRHTYQQLETIREDINQMMEIKVVEVNSLARQIADLNKQIKAIKLAGDQPNDLMDQRDKLLDELAKIVDFQVEPETVTVNGEEVDTGAIKVLIDGSNIVEVDSGGNLVRTLETERDGDGNTVIKWADNTPVTIKNGVLKGLQTVRDEQLKNFTEDLNKLAQTLASKINEIHKQGVDLNGNSVSGTNYENFFVSLDGQEITAANID